MLELLSDLDRAAGWVLMADGVPQSYVDLDDPRHLELEYMRRVGHLVDLTAPEAAPLRVLHLGAGGLTLARYVAATRPGSSQLAVDLDPEVFSLVRERLPLAGRGIALRLADARTALGRVPDGSFDVVVADAFAGPRTPAHLTTVEFTEAAALALAPAGLFAVNAGDGPPLAHARARIATVQAVFPRTCVIAETAVLAGRSFGNFVIAGSGRDLPLAELAQRAAADPYPAEVLAGAALDEFVAGAPVLTDAGAQDSPAPPPGEAD
jgi:spermidine synthase